MYVRPAPLITTKPHGTSGRLFEASKHIIFLLNELS